jgi:hypothetical protein
MWPAWKQGRLWEGDQRGGSAHALVAPMLATRESGWWTLAQSLKKPHVFVFKNYIRFIQMVTYSFNFAATREHLSSNNY